MSKFCDATFVLVYIWNYHNLLWVCFWVVIKKPNRTLLYSDKCYDT